MTERGGSSLAALLRILRRRHRLFLTSALGLPLAAAVVLVLTPNRFTATGTLLVETPQAGLGADLLERISAFTGVGAPVPPTEMYLAILRSERAAFAVAESLDLASHYKVKAKTKEERDEKTLRIMRDKIRFDSPDPVSITIAATDRSPHMAAAIVNAYLDALEQSAETLALSRARRTRIRVERALRETTSDLDSARVRLERFQERYGIVSVEKQAEGMVDLVGTLQGKLLEAQTQRDALAGFTRPGAGPLRNLDYQIAALERQIRRLVGRMEAETASSLRADPDFLRGEPADGAYPIPLREIPRLSGEYAHILIDLKVQETKYSLLATQLEQAKIEESQSIPAFEPLDRARVPHRKSGPKRTLLVLAAALAGGLAAVLGAVLLEDLDRQVDPEARRELDAVIPPFLRRLARRRPAPGDGR